MFIPQHQQDTKFLGLDLFHANLPFICILNKSLSYVLALNFTLVSHKPLPKCPQKVRSRYTDSA